MNVNQSYFKGCPNLQVKTGLSASLLQWISSLLEKKLFSMKIMRRGGKTVLSYQHFAKVHLLGHCSIFCTQGLQMGRDANLDMKVRSDLQQVPSVIFSYKKKPRRPYAKRAINAMLCFSFGAFCWSERKKPSIKKMSNDNATQRRRKDKCSRCDHTAYHLTFLFV